MTAPEITLGVALGVVLGVLVAALWHLFVGWVRSRGAS